MEYIDNPKKIALTSDTFLIAVMSAFGYISAYCYESGYCQYFNIPTELIEINLTKVITVTLILFTVLFTLGHFVSPFIGLIRSENLARRLIGKYVIFFMYCCIVLWSYNNTWIIISVLAPFMLEFYFDVIHPIFWKKTIAGYANKIEAQQSELAAERQRSIWFNDRMGRLLSKETLQLLGLAIITLIIASGMGKTLAKHQKYFLCTTINAPVVILRQYGNTMIGVKLGQKNTIENGIYLLDKSNLKDYGTLSLNKIGPIKPNPSMNQYQ